MGGGSAAGTPAASQAANGQGATAENSKSSVVVVVVPNPQTPFDPNKPFKQDLTDPDGAAGANAAVAAQQLNAQAVPEPGTLLLVGGGVFAIASRTLRRRRRGR